MRSVARSIAAPRGHEAAKLPARQTVLFEGYRVRAGHITGLGRPPAVARSAARAFAVRRARGSGAARPSSDEDRRCSSAERPEARAKSARFSLTECGAGQPRGTGSDCAQRRRAPPRHRGQSSRRRQGRRQGSRGEHGRRRRGQDLHLRRAGGRGTAQVSADSLFPPPRAGRVRSRSARPSLLLARAVRHAPPSGAEVSPAPSPARHISAPVQSNLLQAGLGCAGSGVERPRVPCRNPRHRIGRSAHTGPIATA